MPALERAETSETPTFIKRFHPDNERIQLLAKLCRELQADSGNLPFFLSCRTAAELIEISVIQSSRYLKLLVFEGVLELVSKGGTAQTVRKASRYRYLLDD